MSVWDLLSQEWFMMNVKINRVKNIEIGHEISFTLQYLSFGAVHIETYLIIVTKR